jgi:hypothetical protein
MTFYDVTVEAITGDSEIEVLLLATTPGDRSILAHMLDTEESSGTTAKGSANFSLWNRFAKHGWMEAMPKESWLTDSVPQIRVFRLTNHGRRAVPIVLGRFSNILSE